MSGEVFFKEISYTEEKLSEMSLSELATLHNFLIEVILENKNSQVNKFSDKASAVRRTWKLLEAYKQKENPKKEKQRKIRIKRFTFAPEEKIITLKDKSTLRSQCVTLLEKGATFSEVKELVLNFDKSKEKTTQEQTLERRAYELIRIMHYYLGYGIKHNIETGIIQLITKK